MGLNGRRARVVLVHRGAVLGALAPVSLAMPWWPETKDLVTAVADRDGIAITVLRLLAAEPGRTSGGEVTYLAETDSRPAGHLEPWPDDVLVDHQLRQTWARPGGPGELLSWADERLRARGLEPLDPARQMRSWNLSTLWQIPTTEGLVWLKVVPDFFGHEGAVLDWIGPPVAPELIDFDFGRVLIADIAGAANHEVRDPAALRPMVELLTGLQARSLGRLAELTGRGVPDRRLVSMVPRIAEVVERHGPVLDPTRRRAVEALLTGLLDRLADIAACGVPDALVHGDFHAGNVAGEPGRYVILDWGDSFIGHPLIDELAFTERLPEPVQLAARRWFVDAWQLNVPGSDPARAAALLEPVLPLLAAVTYTDFCAAIEPSERIYHADDAVRMLRTAADSPAPR